MGAVRTAWMWLQNLSSVRNGPEARAAKAYVTARYPRYGVNEVRVLATEPERTVIAVFYEEPDVLSKPLPYVICAVKHDLSVSELPTDAESPYWIRGRK
jgi:hypothetical protein